MQYYIALTIIAYSYTGTGKLINPRQWCSKIAYLIRRVI